jgi:hypothetical protein
MWVWGIVGIKVQVQVQALISVPGQKMRVFTPFVVGIFCRCPQWA